MISREDAMHYVSVGVDDGLSVRSLDEMPADARLVGWQCGFEPMFVAVWSYLPGLVLTDEEAADIAVEYLCEMKWFSGEPTEPDFII